MSHLRDYVAADNGGWIRTFSGGKFFPLAPRVADVRIEDVAHSLATRNRYGGQCRGFYSVAQHCVHVSYHCGPHAAKGLLHDSDEAYSPFGDIPRPVKVQLKHDHPEFAAYIEAMGNRIRDAVYAAFGLDAGEPPEVKAADDAILWDERRVLMSGDLTEMPQDAKGLGIVITPWSWDYAEEAFLRRFWTLTR